MTPNEKLHELEVKKRLGIPLTKDEDSILIKAEIVGRAYALHKIHQLGDPAIIEAKRLEVARLLQEEISKDVPEKIEDSA